MNSLARDAAVRAHEHLTPKTTAYRPASLRAPPPGAAPFTGGTPPAPQRPEPSLSLGKITRDWRCLGRKDQTPENGPVDGVHLRRLYEVLPERPVLAEPRRLLFTICGASSRPDPFEDDGMLFAIAISQRANSSARKRRPADLPV